MPTGNGGGEGEGGGGGGGESREAAVRCAREGQRRLAGPPEVDFYCRTSVVLIPSTLNPYSERLTLDSESCTLHRT